MAQVAHICRVMEHHGLPGAFSNNVGANLSIDMSR